jgi:uncharacterized membrane protein YhiD involved in acid resistance
MQSLPVGRKPMLDNLMLKTTFVNASLINIVYACLLAFLIGVAIAITYVRSFNGLSYSRAFLQALIFAPLLTAVAMQAIGDNVARGLGMMGAFSLLRFRTNIKDTRDMMFMFAALTGGLACGVYAYPIAVVSMIFFCLAVFVVHNMPFNAEPDYDAVLRLQVDNNPELQKSVDGVLRSHARKFSLLSMREMAQGERLDLSYQLKMQKPESQSRIMSELSRVSSLRDMHLFMNDKANEI